jgi:hypothetical protein
VLKELQTVFLDPSPHAVHVPKAKYFFQPKFLLGPIFNFFCGKSLSAKNSAEFLGITIFQNFFRKKFHFFQHIGGKIFRGIFPEIFTGKNVRKIDRRWSQS